jgi:hypothetical protein
MLYVIFLFSTLWSFSRNLQEKIRIEEQNIVSEYPKVVLVTFIFGLVEREASVQIFAESARNSGIDVVIVGSPAPSFSLPPNIRHIPISWQELVGRISNRLCDGKVIPELEQANRRKVNDFKPLFAHLFPELVKGYEWWGHADNDMLLGNVRHFVTPEMLRNYDVISPLPPQDGMLRTWGPFTLYKNSNTTNQLFRLASDPVETLVKDPRLLVLDEGGRVGRRLGKSPWWNSSMSGILTNHYKRLGLRVWNQGIPIVWDGECGKEEEHCAECTLSLPSDMKLRQSLTTKSDLNCISVEDERCFQEVLLCHYQMGKINLQNSTTRGNMVLHLMNDGILKASSLEGFTRSN